MTRKIISFNSDACTLRGWLYLPREDSLGPVPLVVMAHGWAAIKEMFLDDYAEAFAGAGLAVLVFDHRNFGESDGTPRQEIDPWAQVRDYRNAITFCSTLPEIDSGRIGVWGTSYSGGHTLVLGAIDRRVKCIVSQCPTISGWRNTLSRFPGAALESLHQKFISDRMNRFCGREPEYVPFLRNLDPPDLTASDSGNRPDDQMLVGNDGAKWFRSMNPKRLVNWRNQTTLRSLEMYSEYEPGSYIEHISPRPLLMIVGKTDNFTPIQDALSAFERAGFPKKLVILDGGHFDLYGLHREAGSRAASDWFVQYLREARTT